MPEAAPRSAPSTIWWLLTPAIRAMVGSSKRVGFYNPVASSGDVKLRIDLARLSHWESKGAQPSDTVKRLVKQFSKTAVAAA